MSEVASANVGQFTVTTNSGISQGDLETALKPKSDKAASEAASQLGKRGGKASAEARAAREDESKPAEEVDQPTSRPIKPIPPKGEEAKAADAVSDKPEAKPEAEVAEPAESKEEKPAEPVDKAKDKRGDPRHDPIARMHEATRQAAEAKRELAAERQRFEALEARLAAMERGEKPKPAQESPKSNGKPTPQDFDTYEDYLDARDDFNRRQWESEIHQRTQAQSLERTLDQAVDRFRTAAVKIADQISPEVGSLRTEFQLGPNERASGENWIANELVFSPESAPTLMLYFTAHPEELQRIAALSNPRAVSREMAKLETRLEAATAGDSPRPEPEVSKAAPPVKPVTGKPYVSESDEYRPGMSLDEYYRLRRKASR